MALSIHSYSILNSWEVKQGSDYADLKSKRVLLNVTACVCGF